MFEIIATIILVLYVVLGFKRAGIAVVTLPFVCLVVAFASVVSDRIESLVFAPAIFVVTVAVVLFTKRDPDSEEWPQVWAKWMVISLAGLLLVVTSFAVLASLGPLGFLPFLLLIGFVILIVAIASYGATSRQATASYVFSTLGAGMRQNLPLPMALDGASAGQNNKRARTLRRIHKWLVQGYSLSESIKRGYPRCPGYAVAMITAAERINQLPRAIGAIEADMVARAEEKRKIRPIHPLYPLILLSFTLFILLGLMTYVLPQFKSVLEEMSGGAEFPVVTRVLCEMSGSVLYEAAPLWILAVFIAIIVICISIRVRFRPRRPQEPYRLSRTGDFIKWRLPILHWFEKNYSMVHVVELLRLSLNAGCTVNDAIADTLTLDVNNCFRKRLRKWLQKVEVGDNISAAARRSKLPNTLAWAFDEQVNPGNTPAVLETLESFYRSNYSYRANLARFILWPCVSIAMGLIVGTIVYGIFSPLITIIEQMSNIYP